MHAYLDSGVFRTVPHSLVLVQRTLPSGAVRCGIVGALDLEAYDYAPDSVTPIRATEGTVASRLPARVRIRAAAALEMPHIMVFYTDPEDAICREHGTVFLMQIGLTLHSGIKHDGRAPDYDDWTLNGDLLFWNDVLGRAFEISSMGIRVSPESLDHQLTVSGCDDRRELPFHKMLLAGELPLTMGGGIGQSRLCMLMIGTAHIGEVQVSLWDDDTLKTCADAGILLL